MQGNTGSGGGAALGLAIAQNPGLAAAGMGLLAVAFGFYAAANHLDKPEREPLANSIIQTSLEECFNADTHSILYTGEMKNRLMNIWSSDLSKFTTELTARPPICMDEALNSFALPYKRSEVGINYTGEYRIMGLAFEGPNDAVSLVITPYAKEKAENSIDDLPDNPLISEKTLEALYNVPADIYKHVLSDGTTVSVFLQHDGVTQAKGSSKINDNDGSGWADETRINEILQHYSFEWPTRKIPDTAPTPVQQTQGMAPS